MEALIELPDRLLATASSARRGLSLCATGAPHTHSMSCSTDRAMTDEIGAAVRSY
jgi:hypothetical protein